MIHGIHRTILMTAIRTTIVSLLAILASSSGAFVFGSAAHSCAYSRQAHARALGASTLVAVSGGPGTKSLMVGPGAKPGIRVTALAAFLAAAPEGEADESTVEDRELIYKTINFILLVGGLAFMLRKPLGAFFVSRSAEIRAGLEEGRAALAASQARLSTIEDKLTHLQEEIAAFKTSATREMEVERERVQQATAAEAEKMLESARARMETTSRATKLELRFYIAGEALKQAEQIVRTRLDDATRQRLVSRFVARLNVGQNRN